MWHPLGTPKAEARTRCSPKKEMGRNAKRTERRAVATYVTDGKEGSFESH